jgi:hypothetical protein
MRHFMACPSRSQQHACAEKKYVKIYREIRWYSVVAIASLIPEEARLIFLPLPLRLSGLISSRRRKIPAKDGPL